MTDIETQLVSYTDGKLFPNEAVMVMQLFTNPILSLRDRTWDLRFFKIQLTPDIEPTILQDILLGLADLGLLQIRDVSRRLRTNYSLTDDGREYVSKISNR